MTEFCHRFFFFLIVLKIKVQLRLYTNFQPNLSSGSGEKVDFSGFAIFSNCSHFFDSLPA